MAEQAGFLPFKLIPSSTKIDFLGKRWMAFILSMVMLLGSVGVLATKGLNFGIDFTGGIVMELRFQEDVEINEIRKSLAVIVKEDISLQHFGSTKDLLIKIQYGADSNVDTEQSETVRGIQESIKSQYSEVDFRKVDYVGPQVSSELIEKGGMALGMAFIAILLYVWFRFEWQFGVGAIIALVHDVILTLGFISLMQIEFNLSSIAAILTIIGYSINDSVVIFDRIRENLRRFKQMDVSDLLNLSVNSTLSRTLLTAGTTIVALVSLIVLGGGVIEDFSLAVLFGVIIGTYSSIYVASPVLVYMKIRFLESENQSDS
ncbi:MAG: protein translocase subunit SecF [Rickettsiales bacterium]|nr:protein translocase subunit SecF [Rickettsiales bacterium]